VTDTVIVKMIEDSLTNPSGCLFPFRNFATGEYNHSAIWAVLTLFWTAVRETFPEAWGKSPTESRLMHGVGIRSMGKLMDRVMSVVDVSHKDALKQVKVELSKIAPFCRWTSGEWEGIGNVRWDELQNLHKHFAMLSNFLIRTYLDARSKPASV